MEYKPSIADIKFAKQVRDEIIMTQTLNPNAIRVAHQRLFGYPAVTVGAAQRQLAAWFQYTFKPEMLLTKISESLNQVDKTETAEIQTPSVTIDKPTHIEVNGEIVEVLATGENPTPEEVKELEATVEKIKSRRKRINKKK